MRQEEYEGTTSAMRVNSTWLSSEDLLDEGDVKVAIERVFHNRDVDFGEGRRVKECFSLKFVGKDKQLVLNSTNRKILVNNFGTKTRNWIGQEVLLYVTEVQAFGELKNAIRIRANRNRHHPSSSNTTNTKKAKEPKQESTPVDPLIALVNKLKVDWAAAKKEELEGCSKEDKGKLFNGWVFDVVGREVNADFKWTEEDLGKCRAKLDELQKCQKIVDEFDNSDVPPPNTDETAVV